MEVKIIPKSQAAKAKIRVAAYARISKDGEEQEGSIENQIEYFEKQIKSNPEYEFVNVYYDQGISGYKERRPGFQRMMRDARAGKIDLIMTKSITRFARNTDTFLKALRELKGLGIGVFFELQNINSLSESGELLMTVYAAFAQGESESYRELALMRFKKRFAEEGRPEYQLHRTLGYDKDENGEVVIVPEEAEWVKQIFTWTKENYSTATIVKWAAERGMHTKKGKPITHGFITNTVRNIAYKGDYIMQRTYTDENRNFYDYQDVVPSYYIEDDHPAIVSKKLWEAANKIIDGRLKENGYKPGIKPYTLENYPYKDKLYCAVCGRHMYGIKSTYKTQYHFTCGPKTKNGMVYCTGTNIPQQVIESWGPIKENIYVSFDPDKPIHKQYSYVKESTWKKAHKKTELPELPEYNAENFHYYHRVFCAECGHMLSRSRRRDGQVLFTCSGRTNHGKEYCNGIRIPIEKMENLPEREGYYLFKEEIKDGEKHYSYTCKEERPKRKKYIKV